MSRSRSTSGIATVQAADKATFRSRHRAGRRVLRRELEQKLTLLQNDHAELHAMLFEAAQVHRRLCAPRQMRYGDFHIASEIFAVRQLPGDFVIAQESAREMTLALGDVCGKGIAAAMWVTHLAGLVAMHSAASREPRQIVAGVNRQFQQMPAMPLASLFQAHLDPGSGTLDYCNAGHPPALLLRANGTIEALSAGGPLLGALETDSFVQGRVHLQAGDVLVIYSDGILDSTNRAGDQFGYERWEQNVQDMESRSADAVLFSLLGTVQDFADGCPLEDDMSLVVVRRDPREAN
jgi:sigma-B regulation protein RsbU (phosphoserine phosphatase)